MKIKNLGASYLAFVLSTIATIMMYLAARAENPYELAFWAVFLLWSALDEIATLLQLSEKRGNMD